MRGIPTATKSSSSPSDRKQRIFSGIVDQRSKGGISSLGHGFHTQDDFDDDVPVRFQKGFFGEIIDDLISVSCKEVLCFSADLQELMKLQKPPKPASYPIQTDLSTLERNTLYKMILGMAIAKYDYNPEGSRNKATGENAGSISTDLEKVGLPLDADTIREHLKAAFVATPPNQT